MFILRGMRNPADARSRAITLLLAVCASMVAMLIGFLETSSPAWAQGNSAAPSLEFLNDPLDLQLKEGKIPVKVIVRNGSGQSVNLRFSAVLRNGDGDLIHLKSIEPRSSTSIGPYKVKPVGLDFEATDPSTSLAGQFVVSATNNAKIVPGAISLKLDAPENRPSSYLDPFNWLLIGSLLSAAVVILGACLIGQPSRTVGNVEIRPHPGWSLGTKLTLDFDKSWASLLTLVGGVLSPIAAATLFPEERPYLSAEEIAGLGLCFGGMLLFAPTFYNLLRTRAIVSPKLKDASQEEDTKEEYQGFIWSFLVASTFTLGALFGQLATTSVLVYQIGTAVSGLGKVVLYAGVGIIGVYAAVYAVRKIRSVLEQRVEEREKEEEASQRLLGIIEEERWRVRPLTDQDEKERLNQEVNERLNDDERFPSGRTILRSYAAQERVDEDDVVEHIGTSYIDANLPGPQLPYTTPQQPLAML